MTTDLQHLAKIVKERRTEMKMTQKELAARVGAHEQTIGNLERGKTETDAATLARIGKVLSLNLGDSTAVLTTQVTAQAVDAIRAELITRASAMPSSVQLVYFGEVMSFVTRWTPARR